MVPFEYNDLKKIYIKNIYFANKIENNKNVVLLSNLKGDRMADALPPPPIVSPPMPLYFYIIYRIVSKRCKFHGPVVHIIGTFQQTISYLKKKL